MCNNCLCGKYIFDVTKISDRYGMVCVPIFHYALYSCPIRIIYINLANCLQSRMREPSSRLIYDVHH